MPRTTQGIRALLPFCLLLACFFPIAAAAVRPSPGDLYGVTSVPNMFIFGTVGVVEHTHVGYGEEMLPEFIGEMLDLLPPEVLARPAGT